MAAAVLRKEPCPKCRKEGHDKAGNNLIIYSDGGEYCYAGHGILKLSETFKEQNNIKQEVYKEINMGPFDLEMWQNLKDTTNTNPKGYRGLSEATCAKYGVRHAFDEVTGKVKFQYYPVTKAGNLSGVRWRDMDKEFYNKGEVGGTCDLFGQASFANITSYKQVILASGEIDTMSIFDMLAPQSIAKGYEPTPVVCATVGEGGFRQYQNQYEWLNKFEKIIICPDKDSAGEKHMHRLAQVLPKDKVFIIDLPKKDANEMLEKGFQEEFVKRYWRNRAYNPSGIVGSSSLYEAMVDDLKTAKLPFPPFMHKFQKMLAGGLKLGSIMNVGAASGIGKSTVINEMIYHWIFNSPYKIGIISLELSCGQYGKALASRHLGRKLDLIEDPEEAVAYVEDPKIIAKIDHLYKDEHGLDRFHLVDERDGGIDNMKSLIEKLVISCDCRVIVIDPLQDLMAGLSNDGQELFLAWMKGMIKRYDMIFINISHVRKSNNGKEKSNSEGGFISEEDFAGSSTIFKSASVNFLFTRNKYLPDGDINKNVTKSYCSKNRNTGLTGDSGDYYYENETHTLYSIEEYKELRPELFPSGPDEEKDRY